MKNTFFLFLLFFSVASLNALDASLSFARFASPQSNYIELYLHVSGKTVQAQALSDSTVQGAVKVLVVFEKDGEVVQFDKFQLNSPIGKRVVDFIDLKRYPLKNGQYLLRVEVEDAANPEKNRKYNTAVDINFTEEELSQSDIQLLASVSNTNEEGPMVKNGLLMEPLPFNFYGRGANVLTFYHEIYNSDQHIGEDFVLSYKVEKLENAEAKSMLIGHKRQQAAKVNPVLQSMDISKLPSGNYQLVVEVRNRERELISSRSSFFQRSNPVADTQELEEVLASVRLEDEFVSKLSHKDLEYSLRAIVAILPSNDVEMVDIILRTDSIKAQRMYLYSFWLKENKSNPEQAYNSYMEVAQAVDNMYQSGFRHGFETDRGYVYMKYGQPSDIVRNESEPSAPPYEIWSYNLLEKTKQNNVKFIFYNPSLVADDFILLHSDAIGERNNPQWQLELYKDAPDQYPLDYFGGENVQDNIGRRSRRLLNDY